MHVKQISPCTACTYLKGQFRVPNHSFSQEDECYHVYSYNFLPRRHVTAALPTTDHQRFFPAMYHRLYIFSKATTFTQKLPTLTILQLKIGHKCFLVKKSSQHLTILWSVRARSEEFGQFKRPPFYISVFR